MANGFGAKVKLEGESEFKTALREINTSLKLVSSELKVTSTEFERGDKSVKEAKASYSSMNNTVEDQKKKIATLKDTVAEMTKKYGEDNEQVKVFKTQLNNAEAQLLKMDDATSKNTKEIKEMGKSMDDAGSSGLKLGDIIKANLISEAVIGGVKALGSAFKEVTGAIIDFGKEAITSYADYQQLVGGVDTLFKESSQQVQQYAQEAYKTAGVSANEYMAGVTNFSASLMQSLKGDTAKATEVANQAFIDMSDNANKMGTDMSAIQSAYQGFAKQNYTMLDNLKLGYGGTKTEMQRLLADAQAITGVKYDISNLADVYNAIHVIQEKLEITGTTAKEAGTTISGSINMMKASWKNLMVAFADPEGTTDIKANIQGLMESVFGDGTEDNLGVMGNLLPSIQAFIETFAEFIPIIVEQLSANFDEFIGWISEMIVSFVEVLIQQIPQLIASLQPIITQLIQYVISRLPEVIALAGQIIGTLAQALISNLPQIIQTGIEVIVSLITGLAEAMPTLIPTIVDAVVLMVETLIDNIDMLIDAGIQLTIGIAEGLINALPILIDKIPVLIDKLVDAIVNNLPKIIEMGVTLTVKLAEGLVKAIPQLISKIPQLISSLVKALAGGIGSVMEVGKNLVQGLWNGINNAKDWVLDKIKGFGKAVLDGIKSFFGIHSPSTVFRDQIGQNLALGIGEGFTDTMSDISKDMADSIPTEFDSNLTTNITSPTTGSGFFNQDALVSAFKEALKDVKVVMNEREMGNFVTDTVERVVYS